MTSKCKQHCYNCKHWRPSRVMSDWKEEAESSGVKWLSEELYAPCQSLIDSDWIYANAPSNLETLGSFGCIFFEASDLTWD